MKISTSFRKLILVKKREQMAMTKEKEREKEEEGKREKRDWRHPLSPNFPTLFPLWVPTETIDLLLLFPLPTLLLMNLHRPMNLSLPTTNLIFKDAWITFFTQNKQSRWQGGGRSPFWRMWRDTGVSRAKYPLLTICHSCFRFNSDETKTSEQTSKQKDKKLEVCFVHSASASRFLFIPQKKLGTLFVVRKVFSGVESNRARRMQHSSHPVLEGRCYTVWLSLFFT